ncbi:Sialidase domain-containing protein [Mycena kentingensis (nom. inval.)]|nr:Sialidase domain-containing protein [Mycena kentingensis (nom. inval.)]
MFNLAILKDTVAVHPSDFGAPPQSAIISELNKKYANRLLHDVGLCICVFDLTEAGEGKVRYGDGFLNLPNGHFQPIRSGRCSPGRECAALHSVPRLFRRHLRTRAVPTSAKRVVSDSIGPPPARPTRPRRDPNERAHFRLASNPDINPSEMLDTPIDERMWIDKGEVVRIRVESDEFYDDEPGPVKMADGVQVIRDLPTAPFTIFASMAEQELGPTAWWVAAEEGGEDLQAQEDITMEDGGNCECTKEHDCFKGGSSITIFLTYRSSHFWLRLPLRSPLIMHLLSFLSLALLGLATTTSAASTPVSRASRFTTIAARENNLVPSVSPTDIIPSSSGGTYPRLAQLKDGSILGSVTRFQDGQQILTVTRSVDNGNTFVAWGTVAVGNGGDMDNVYIEQMPSGDLLATFRNHDKNADGEITYYRITACISHTNGQTWEFLSHVDERVATANNNGLWEPFVRIAKSGAIQVYYAAENNAVDQDILMRSSTNNGQSWSTSPTVVAGATTTGRDGMPGCADYTTPAGEARVMCIFETTEGSGSFFNAKSVVSSDDGVSFGGRASVFSPPSGKNAGAPQITASTKNTLVASFMTDEDSTAANNWPNNASFKILTSPGETSATWGRKTTVLGTASFWPGLFSATDGTIVGCADNKGARCRRITLSVTRLHLDHDDAMRLPASEIVRDAESFNEIIDGLYLGNLSAAETAQTMARLGITHIVSVCPDPLEVDKAIWHLTIPVIDDEEANLLEHFSTACTFIDNGLKSRKGKVFVHCVMGISRSATVLCAYLMFVRHISPARAIQFVRQRREKIRPNYNFVRQLQVFAACNYQIRETESPYRRWQQDQAFSLTQFIRVPDAMPLTDRLFLSFDLPSSLNRSKILLDHFEITHLVTVTPDRISSVPEVYSPLSSRQTHKQFIAPYTSKESLLLSLPLICQFIALAMETTNSRVLIHSMDDSRASLAACAYFMYSRQINASDALVALQDGAHLFLVFLLSTKITKNLRAGVPLFQEDAVFRHQLDLFGACQYAPTAQHPLVRAWLSARPIPIQPMVAPAPTPTPLSVIGMEMVRSGIASARVFLSGASPAPSPAPQAPVASGVGA